MKKPKPTPAPDGEAASYAASIVTPPANAITRAEGRGDVTISDDGLKFIRHRASEGASQTLIACELQLSATTFKAAMKRDEKIRIAWEHGREELQQEFVSLLIASARKGNYVPILFGLKALFGFVEGQQPVTDNRVAVQIVLPDAMTPEAFERMSIRKVTRPVLPAPLGQGGTTR
jgi:hypothetical protein